MQICFQSEDVEHRVSRIVFSGWFYHELSNLLQLWLLQALKVLWNRCEKTLFCTFDFSLFIRERNKENGLFPSECRSARINMDWCLCDQTPNRHCVLVLRSRFARVFEWAARQAVRPWETHDMKAVVCAPRKFCWHLITKRGEWKKITRSPRRSRRVILRERNLCDIDRIVHKGGRFACARQHTHNSTSTFFFH